MGCIKEAIAVVVNNVNNKRSKFVDVNNQESADVSDNNAGNAVNAGMVLVIKNHVQHKPLLLL